jgi:hypothetical protein
MAGLASDHVLRQVEREPTMMKTVAIASDRTACQTLRPNPRRAAPELHADTMKVVKAKIAQYCVRVLRSAGRKTSVSRFQNVNRRDGAPCLLLGRDRLVVLVLLSVTSHQVSFSIDGTFSAAEID